MATTTQATTDDSVREDVLRELKWDPRLSSENDIAVAVKDKVVTLSGFVPTFWDKDAAALRRSAELDARRIRVEVKHGTVTLLGRVRSWAEREEAERAAWSSPGTTVVENEIVVEP
jgi:osmotically-inducible protein OsmY